MILFGAVLSALLAVLYRYRRQPRAFIYAGIGAGAFVFWVGVGMLITEILEWVFYES